MGTKTLTATSTIIAEITKSILSSKDKKLSVLAIGGLILSLGDDVKIVGENFKSIPAEWWDMDSDEGQQLSAEVKNKLGDKADETSIDEIIGALMVSATKIRDGVDELTGVNTSWENKGLAVGDILSCVGKIIDASIHKSPIIKFAVIAGDKSF